MGLIPRLAAAETMDIEGTEMGPDWRGEGEKEGGREGWREGRRAQEKDNACEGGKERVMEEKKELMRARSRGRNGG
ncbi:MAG: hypothetical protein ETSY2_54555 [Candidatus Entotheonella gemina]|uniref:Uncharacterized protein n=1 Tax=Candidatus Entotheonella gemina TaxID=1429439 RepID=W4L2F3_9BACT|nr:MAG: hypothetical protein ETSY2_54555 [Candidatus Entotheonella gemina]